jgi:hypothetical protein
MSSDVAEVVAPKKKERPTHQNAEETLSKFHIRKGRVENFQQGRLCV